MSKWKRELANKDEKVLKKQTTASLEVKFESNINEIIEEIADCGNVDTATIGETLDRQLEELSEVQLVT